MHQHGHPFNTPVRRQSLIHIIADPRHFTALKNLNCPPETHTKLYLVRDDPWGNYFRELFNDPIFEPVRPGTCDSVTGDILFSFHLNEHPLVMSAGIFRSRRTLVSEIYTICYNSNKNPVQG